MTARRATTLVLLAAVLFGTTGTAQALGPDSTTPLTVGAVRLLVGGSALLAFVLLAGGRLVDVVAVWRTPAGLVAGFFVAAYQVFFFAGVAKAGVAAGTLVTIGSAPFITGLLALAVGFGRPTRGWVVSTAVAVAGLVLLSAGGASGGGADGRGLWLSLASGFGYAAYAVASKHLLDAGHPPDAVMAGAFFLGAVLLVPVLIAGPLGWLATPSGVALALYLGLLPTAVAYLLFSRGLVVLPAGTVATLTLAEPVVATLLGALLLGEHLGLAGLAGMALIITGLSLLGVTTARARRPLGQGQSAA